MRKEQINSISCEKEKKRKFSFNISISSIFKLKISKLFSRGAHNFGGQSFVFYFFILYNLFNQKNKILKNCGPKTSSNFLKSCNSNG